MWPVEIMRSSVPLAKVKNFPSLLLMLLSPVQDKQSGSGLVSYTTTEHLMAV